ncbi:MAG: type II secretion system secretin GspD [Rhizobiales bacterium]|nr:type II secretion system secretin GspD [Hyphomicrobiales bacterium]
MEELPTSTGEPGVTLNLVNVPINQAAKTVLGEVLGLNFVVDDRVQGAISVQTTKPISKEALIDLFETVLRSRGAAIVEDGGFYRILPLEDARVGLPDAQERAQGRIGPGLAVQIVPVAYVSAEEMRGILEPIAPAGGVLRIDGRRNLIVIAGTASELNSMREAIELFDVDWMKGMSFALHPLKSAEPTAVASELDTIFDTAEGPSKQMVRFVPNKRLNAVLVISSRPRYLAEAASWIARLDQVADAQADKLVVYQVHNRSASELAPILTSVFSRAGRASPQLDGDVAPALEPVEIEASGDDVIAEPPIVEAPPTIPPNSDNAAPGITADEADNSLLIYASAEQHERIEDVLGRLDRLPTQVLLEATIAEVSLGDDLRFGLRWFLESGNFAGNLTDAESGGIGSVFPGFSFLFSTGNTQAVLSALSSVTDVKIVSSPTLMVLDNKKATLQVGDQVPIVTQTARSTTDGDAAIVNSVELRDTGVILVVQPHVNESGRVVLDIQQEVSTVVQTTTSGIDSPTIRQRKISTTIVVGDGESLALGGLIQDRNVQRRAKVPVIGDIPVVGNAFRRKEDSVERTELIILIRPRIVHDVEEARTITEDFRDGLVLTAPADRDPLETMERDAGRALN